MFICIISSGYNFINRSSPFIFAADLSLNIFKIWHFFRQTVVWPSFQLSSIGKQTNTCMLRKIPSPSWGRYHHHYHHYHRHHDGDSITTIVIIFTIVNKSNPKKSGQQLYLSSYSSLVLTYNGKIFVLLFCMEWSLGFSYLAPEDSFYH